MENDEWGMGNAGDRIQKGLPLGELVVLLRYGSQTLAGDAMNRGFTEHTCKTTASDPMGRDAADLVLRVLRVPQQPQQARQPRQAA